MLKIKNLTKKYNSNIILKDIDLCVKHGEVALLLGSSGVGKSTLLRILNNLESYSTGSIYLNDQPLNIEKVNKTHTVGMVFQHFNLFVNMTTLGNITFALEKTDNKTPKEARTIAYNLLKQYGLEDKAHLYINKLSGGQKQRLSIARTLALKPQVICMDEPTSALDPSLTNSVAKSIMELAKNNYIVLVASHDIALIEKLDCTLYLMSNGSIVECAQSQDFLKNKDNYPAIKHFVKGSAG